MKRGLVYPFLILVFGFPPIMRSALSSDAPLPQSSPSPQSSPQHANPHLVGWGNLFVPGLGETLNGNPVGGATQFGYETATFLWGYSLSPRSGISSLDGISDSFQPYNRNQRNSQVSINSEISSDMILEFAIKSHMTNTFVAYRDAYAAEGITEGLDQHTWWEGFKVPFQKKSFDDPWVYIPLALIAAGLTVDYLTSSPDNNYPAFTPTSNFIYGAHYGIWEPLGSGWPEESFYRGFLQHEFTTATNSPLIGVLAESAAFAFSHEAGSGRLSAAAVGAYLGFLSWKYDGNLSPGITVHFWGDLLLGVETILISHRDQRSTPQSALGVQFNY